MSSTETVQEVAKTMREAWIDYIGTDAYLDGNVRTQQASRALENAETAARNLHEEGDVDEFRDACKQAIRELDALTSLVKPDQQPAIEGVLQKCQAALDQLEATDEE